MGNLASVVDELLAVDRRELPSATVAGMGVGQWTLHPAGQEIVQTALQALSKPVPGDDRSPAQRRADALTPGAAGADYAFGATTSAEGARRFACDAGIVAAAARALIVSM